MDSKTVTLEIIHGGGQLRAYGDHIYEGFLTFLVPEKQMFASKYGHTEDVAKQYLRVMVCNWVDDYEGIDNFYSPHLEKLEQVSPGRWHYRITSPYID